MNNAGAEPAPPAVCVVDPHHHVQDLSRFDYPWLAPHAEPPAIFGGKFGELRRNYLRADYLADAGAVQVIKSVHIENGCASSQSLAETDWLQSVADGEGHPQGLVVHVALQAPDTADQLDRHLRSPNVRGVRQILNWRPEPALRFVENSGLMRDAAWRRGFAALAKRNLSFDLQIYPQQLADARDLAASFKDTHIALCHAGMPVDRSQEALDEWEAGMKDLASAPNVWVKLSGLSLGPGAFAFASARTLALKTIDIFGVDRCMFASNFPVDRLFCTFEALYAAFREIVDGFSEAEQNALFRTNAERFYRL